MILATKTQLAIDAAIELDGGAKFRGFLKEAMAEIGDAFDTKLPEPRTHLGGSLIGRKCPRELWYGFRWAKQEVFDARILRLFNRGHLEEARFIAMLRCAGMTIWTADEKGKQFRISAHEGHYGGAIDGVVRGCPDFPNEPILAEFKTSGYKAFAKMVKEGVQKAKPEHYVQMNQYMGYYQLPAALYCMVEKDTDKVHYELVMFDKACYEQFLDRAGRIIFSPGPPPKIAESSSWFDCKFCSKSGICHDGCPVDRNCRTCDHSRPSSENKWYCLKKGVLLDKADQLAGCPAYLVNSKI